MSQRKSINEMAKEVIDDLAIVRIENEELYNEFANASSDELAFYHHTIGRNIRNIFGLWEHKWEPELVDGIDYSPNHPDAISMEVIKEVHRRVNQQR